MKTSNPLYVKNSVLKESFHRLGVHAYLLIKKGASLGLLATVLHMKSYNSIYKLIIAENKDAQRGNRRRPPAEEQKWLAKWEQNNPAIAAAMKESDITPRKWCCIYELITPENNADFYALTNPQGYEGNTDVPVLSFLQRDFPAAFGLKASRYWPTDVNPDLFCHHKIEHPNDRNMHVLSLDSLGIKIMNKSYSIAFNAFTKRLRHEVNDHRLVLLLNGGLNEENINAALSWLPQDVSNDNITPAVLNQGIGYQIMRRREEEARLRSPKLMVSASTL